MVSSSTNSSAANENENGGSSGNNDVGLAGAATSHPGDEEQIRTSFAAEAQRSSMVMNPTLLNILNEREEDSGRGNGDDEFDDAIAVAAADAKLKLNQDAVDQQQQLEDSKMKEEEKKERLALLHDPLDHLSKTEAAAATTTGEVKSGSKDEKKNVVDIDKKNKSHEDKTRVGAIPMNNPSKFDGIDDEGDETFKKRSSTATTATGTFSYDDLVPTSLERQGGGGSTSAGGVQHRRDIPPPGAYQLHSDGTLTRLESGRPNAPTTTPEQALQLGISNDDVEGGDGIGTSPTVLHAETSADSSGLIQAHTVDDVVEVHAKPIEWWTPRKTILVVVFSLAMLAIIVGISVASANNRKSISIDDETGLDKPTLPPAERLQAIKDVLLEYGYNLTETTTTALMVNGTDAAVDDIDAVNIALGNSTASTTANDTTMPMEEDFAASGGGTLALDDPSTPQYSALQWLALVDEYNVSVDNVGHLLQRYALAVLYFATGGNSTWIDSFEFLSDEHECNWSGALQCESSIGGASGESIDGTEDNEEASVAVTGIELQANELVGQLPTVELSFLSNLKYLDVGRNGLSGALPMNLPPQLTYLELYKNEFTGTIPNEYSRMTDLEYLRMSFNQLSGALPQDLGALTKLTILNIEENILTGSFPDSIWNLSRLEMFNFDTQKEMTGTISSKIGNFHNLTVLLVNGLNGLTGSIPTEIGHLTKLVELKTAQSHMRGPLPSEIGLLTNLEFVAFSRNGYSGTLPTEFARLTNLVTLYIQATWLTGSMEAFCNARDSGDIPNLITLNADQGEVDCTCCTCCIY